MNVLIGLLLRYRMVLNVTKSKTSTYQPVTIRSWMEEEAMGCRCTVRGGAYHKRTRRRIHCPDCGVELSVGLMTTNMRQMHGKEPETDWNRLTISRTERIPQVFDVSFLNGVYQCQRPFHGCPGPCRSGMTCETILTVSTGE